MYNVLVHSCMCVSESEWVSACACACVLTPVLPSPSGGEGAKVSPQWVGEWSRTPLHRLGCPLPGHHSETVGGEELNKRNGKDQKSELHTCNITSLVHTTLFFVGSLSVNTHLACLICAPHTHWYYTGVGRWPSSVCLLLLCSMHSQLSAM